MTDDGQGHAFSYDEAFSRNIGWVTEAEQARLRGSRIAIAGLGGVGGSHLITLARLGIGKFHIADFDAFSLANFNRQAGANLGNVDRPKIDAMAEMALAINPELDIERFPSGVRPDNLERFLEGVDLYVDGLDYFALDIRRAVFARCAELGIPAVTAAPLGMGVALMTFMPGGMKFDDYFRLEGCSPDEQAIRFLLGLSPRLLQRGYLVDISRVDFSARRGPSTVMACELCAGFAATECLKILLGRGPIRQAPRGVHFDAYRHRLVRTWRPFGNANPIQRMMLAFARRQLAKNRPVSATRP
jgi:molybdopterin/thiamine biosynthesis adenylyltransferase